MKEKNLLAYFKSMEEAQAAMQQIKQLNLTDSSIRRVDGYPGDGNERIMNPITSDFHSLGYLTLDAEITDHNAGILSAASVSASGFSSGGPDNRVTGRDVLLTAVMDANDYEKAVRAAEEHGGLV
ncbi:hypothetical protein [Paenibacillus tarimensis]|uniref:hypothetical protein n=1 Tax=Paenibacillus tarimensis TaxID=416012 RepID=UPI001F27540E|nr:hypothetical protein [Paenibacillus tarimensis]MCF2944823.1 hypothetical protein [Paenibacillus tarimensis]